MRHVLATAFCTVLLLFGGSAAAGERTVTLAVENMTCFSCPYIVKEALTRIDGVTAVDVYFEEKKAVVRYDDARASVEALTAATTRHGFPSSVIE